MACFFITRPIDDCSIERSVEQIVNLLMVLKIRKLNVLKGLANIVSDCTPPPSPLIAFAHTKAKKLMNTLAICYSVYLTLLHLSGGD